MEIQSKSADRNLMLLFSGEMDHHGARNALREVELAIDAALPQKLVMDFAGVTFMDSSGIGLVMGRYKLLSEFNGKLEVTGLSNNAYKVMRLAGLDRIATIKKGGK